MPTARRMLVLLSMLILMWQPSLALQQAPSGALPTSSQTPTRIVIDGNFDDWQTLSPTYEDALGDAPDDVIDFGKVWITNDEQFLFIRFELGIESLIQDLNQIVLYLDTDANAATGLAYLGIGAELSWSFGDRDGIFYSGGELGISHNVLGIVTGPTVSSHTFEVAIALDAIPDGQQNLFTGADIRMAIEDAPQGDVAPDTPGGIAYTIEDGTILPPLAPISLRKQNASDVRVLSYNVHLDDIFDPAHQPAFERILQAIEPDIIGFQEILSHSAEQTKALVESMLPLPAGESWHAARIVPDLVVVSRYPVLESFSIPRPQSGDANAAFLLDMEAPWGTELLLLNGHPPCCDSNDARQMDIDGMMAFVRDARAAGGQLDLELGTPIIIVGDMNLVGWNEQLHTLLTGSIVNTDLFGPAFNPDWDDSPFTDLSPRHVALPMTFTWYNENSSFHPGRLDYIVYSDAVLQAQNNFVLFTPSMHPDSLEAYQLLPTDATLASDHLPVVGDFQIQTFTSTNQESDNSNTPGEQLRMQHFPNPFSEQLTVAFDVPRPTDVKLSLFNALGQEVALIQQRRFATGPHQVEWDASSLDLPAGVYFLRLELGDKATTQPVLHMVH